MSEREKEFVFETAVVIAGMVPVALLALALVLR